MKAREVMIRDFRVVDASWPTERTRAALARYTARFIVVRRKCPHYECLYYVFERTEMMRRLAQPQATDTSTALGLHEGDAVHTVAPNAVPQPSLQMQVVLGDQGPAGIVVSEKAIGVGDGEKSPVFPGLRERVSALGNYGGPRATRGTTRGFSHGQRAEPPTITGDSNAGATDPGPTGPVTRHLIGDLPSGIVAGSTVSLLVSLDSAAPLGTSAAPLVASVGARIDIVVKTIEGLSLAGPGEGTLQVSDPQDDLPIQFKLTAGAAGHGCVHIYAFGNGMAIARLKLTTTIVAAAAAAPQDERESVSISIAPRTQPDLSMYIFEQRNTLSFHLSSADGHFQMNKFGPTQLVSDPRDYFRTFFADIENLPLENPQQRQVAKRRLEAKGADMFDKVFPDDLKALLWDLRDRIQTVQITSDEPWIPWEVCRLKGINSGRVEAGKFFAEAFSVTRWLYGVSAAPRLRINNLALVVPGDSQLAQASTEKDYVLSLAGPKRRVTEIPSTYLDLTDAMITGKYDVWHFTGHARADDHTDADHAVIELANREKLTPEDIVGNVENVLEPRPFVFLNACQSAQAGQSLTRMGGWAQRFLKPGSTDHAASAFVGSYWSVYDEAACAFAKSLYQGLLAGKPIGQAAKEARLAISTQEDPTWLAYTVYADPYATIEA